MLIKPIVFLTFSLSSASLGRKVPISGAPGAREQSPIAKKFGNLSIPENLVKTSSYDRTLTAQTLGKGEGSQESARRGRSILWMR